MVARWLYSYAGSLYLNSKNGTQWFLMLGMCPILISHFLNHRKGSNPMLFLQAQFILVSRTFYFRHTVLHSLQYMFPNRLCEHGKIGMASCTLLKVLLSQVSLSVEVHLLIILYLLRPRPAPLQSLAYPEPSRRGRMLSLWVFMRSAAPVGAYRFFNPLANSHSSHTSYQLKKNVVGGAIIFGVNFGTNSSGGVSLKTYLVIIGISKSALFSPSLLLYVRDD